MITRAALVALLATVAAAACSIEHLEAPCVSPPVDDAGSEDGSDGGGEPGDDAGGGCAKPCAACRSVPPGPGIAVTVTVCHGIDKPPAYIAWLIDGGVFSCDGEDGEPIEKCPSGIRCFAMALDAGMFEGVCD